MKTDIYLLARVLQTANIRQPLNVTCTQTDKRAFYTYFEESLIVFPPDNSIEASKDYINIAAWCNDQLIVMCSGNVTNLENGEVTILMDFSMGPGRFYETYSPFLKDCLEKASWIYEEYVKFQYRVNSVKIDDLRNGRFLEYYTDYGYKKIETPGGYTLYEKDLTVPPISNFN